MNQHGSSDRLHALLADRTGGCLPYDERVELSTLLSEYPETEPDEFDEAAAALHLALFPPVLEEVPADVRARLDATARAWFAARPAASAPFVEPKRGVGEIESVAAAPHDDTEAAPPARRLLASPWSGWIAAAAAVLVAFLGWRLGPGSGAQQSDPVNERVALLSQKDTGQWSWSTTEDPLAAGASGDVVWSSADQRGYMRFAGLRPNDPREAQYQLWIFDGERAPGEPDADPLPVDGGVFDVPEGASEVVVPIDPKLLVGRPTLFAITLERPGGVVVSKQEHVLLVAKPE